MHTDKSTQRYTNTPTWTNQYKEREIGVGIGCLWISGSVLMAKIRVYRLMEIGLHACELVLAVEIVACGSTVIVPNISSSIWEIDGRG